MAEIEIIDAHAHITRSEDHGRETWSYFMRRGPVTGHTVEPPCYGTVPEIQKLMQATGVAHSNLLMFTWSGRYYRDGLYTLPDEPDRRAIAEKELKDRIVQRVRDNNDWALSAVSQHNNLSCFCGIDPVLMDEKTLLAEVEDKTRRGALGVKMVPLDLRIRGNDRRLWPVYEYCQSKGIPVLAETSGRPGASGHPTYFGEALKEFPRLKIIFAHFGHDPNFGQGADAEVVELANTYEGVFADVSLRFPEVAHGHVAPEDMVAHLRRIGIDRVLYGSNYYFVEMSTPDPKKEEATVAHPQFTNTKKSVEVLLTLPLKDAEREKMASKNFRQLVSLQG